MEIAATLLIDETKETGSNSFIKLRIWRDRFRTAFNETEDEASRIALLKEHAEIYDHAEAYFHGRLSELAFLQEVRKSEWNALCYIEAHLCSGSSYLIPGELQRIWRREFVAGRMEEKTLGSNTE